MKKNQQITTSEKKTSIVNELIKMDDVEHQQQDHIDFVQFLNLYEKRKEIRLSTILNLSTQNYPKSFLQSEKLLKISLSILQFNKTEKLYNYLKRVKNIQTCETNEDLEYLFDIGIIFKVYLKMKKIGEIYKKFQEIQFPIFKLQKSDLSPSKNNSNQYSKSQLIQINKKKQLVIKYEAILKIFIEIMKNSKLIQFVDLLYQKYIQLIKQCYGENLEMATVYFEFASYLISVTNSSTNFNQNVINARNYFLNCKKIREKYGQSLGVADVLYNLGLIENNLGNIDLACSYITQSLTIKKDILSQPSLNYCTNLQGLAKLKLCRGQFKLCYAYLKQCFQIRKRFFSRDNKQVKRICVLIIFLYRILEKRRKVTQDKVQSKQLLQKLFNKIKQELFVQPEFDNYQIQNFENQIQLQIPFELRIDQAIFTLFSEAQVRQYIRIQKAIHEMPAYDAIRSFMKSKFFHQLNYSIKERLVELNPALERYFH